MATKVLELGADVLVWQLPQNGFPGEDKPMKKTAFVITGAASLVLAACGGANEDTVDNAEMNQPIADELNQLSTDAANDAANAEAAALGEQQNQLEQEPADNTNNPSDEQEQNVAGM